MAHGKRIVTMSTRCLHIVSKTRKRSKYGAKPTADGFASKAERVRYEHLHLMERGHNISDLQVHPVFQVEPPGCAPIRYTADFMYIDAERHPVVEDVKGTKITEGSSVRFRLFLWKYPHLPLYIVRAIYSRGGISGFHSKRWKVRKAKGNEREGNTRTSADESRKIFKRSPRPGMGS